MWNFYYIVLRYTIFSLRWFQHLVGLHYAAIGETPVVPIFFATKGKRAIAASTSAWLGDLSCSIEIAEIYNLDIPEDESYQTLAGYILESTGSIPEAGESVVIDERRFDIIKKSATRLELIRLTLPTTAAEEE